MVKSIIAITFKQQVFLVEYAGPLLVYLLFFPRPGFIYGGGAALKPRANVVWLV